MALEATMQTGVAEGAAAASPGAWRNLVRAPVKQLVALMIGAAAATALAVGAWLWTQAPDYRLLYGNLSDRDGGAVIAALTQMNIPYKFSEGGGAILVPASHVYDARLRLASQGLPRGSVVGFELVDNQKFGATQFQEQVNYQRGLEGELARSIQSLSAVQNARVHLAIPKPSVFLREQQGPSASVLVALHPGKTLERAQVTGILNLVASSVPELSPNNVSILDQNGNLLSKNGAGIDQGGLDSAQLSYIRQIEQATNQRIVDILEPIVGRNNARVQVTADVDFSRIEAVAETFKPNQEPKVAAVRSQQSAEASSGGVAGAGGVPGALSNQPPASGVASLDGKASAASTAASTSSANTRKDETINYEVDKTIQHTKNPVGGIKRLTAAIVVNFKKQTDEQGKVSMTPLPAPDMEKINALVRDAMGFSKERGDSVNVVNAAFNEPEKEAAAPDVPMWKDPANIALAKDTGRYVLVAALIAYLFFGVLRPMLRQAMEAAPEPAPVAPPSGNALLSSAAETRTGNLQLARNIAREDPKIVANVVKSWVTKDE